ncbi:MAG: FtsQ-type POTRA domain-containing protein [Vampirovibrionales bacterium]|nr:FtsQ-type POTRA domain-containing protein [Vampirovibrionales bacterium]
MKRKPPRSRALRAKPVAKALPGRLRAPTPPEKSRGSRPKPIGKIPAGKRAQDVNRARGRQQAYLQARRKRKRILVMCSRLRFLVKLCFLLLLCFTLWQFATASFWAMDAPRIRVENAHLIASDAIAPAVGALKGLPITQIDPQALEKWLKRRYPILDRAVVRRALFPARLTLTVSEKPLLAQVYTDVISTRPSAVITYDADVLSLAPYQRAVAAFPQRGLLRIYVNPGQRLPRAESRRLAEIAEIARGMTGLTFEWIDFRNPQQTMLMFSQVKVNLGALDVTAPRRLARLTSLIPIILEKVPTIDAVNLQWLNQVTFHRGNDAWQRSHSALRQSLRAPASADASLPKGLLPSPTDAFPEEHPEEAPGDHPHGLE